MAKAPATRRSAFWCELCLSKYGCADKLTRVHGLCEVHMEEYLKITSGGAEANGSKVWNALVIRWSCADGRNPD